MEPNPLTEAEKTHPENSLLTRENKKNKFVPKEQNKRDEEKIFCKTKGKNLFYKTLIVSISLAGSSVWTEPASAQFNSSIGGLRMVTYDPQSLYARKIAESGTNSSGPDTSTGGGSTSAETDLVLSDGTITAIGVSGNTKSTMSHKGFTTDGSIILGPSTLSTSAFALADPTAVPAVDPVVINYSAYTSLILVREARSINPSFINSFSNSLR